MKSKIQKSEELKKLKDRIPGSKIVIFTTFSPSARSGQARTGEKGLSVAQMTALKRLLRGLDSEYFVTKKTIIDLATKGKSFDGLDIYKMDGSVGLVLGDSDPYRVSKDIYDFSKKNPALHFWGAITGGKFVDVNSFLEMAKLPTKEILIGRLIGMLTYPMRGLAVALSEITKTK